MGYGLARSSKAYAQWRSKQIAKHGLALRGKSLDHQVMMYARQMPDRVRNEVKPN